MAVIHARRREADAREYLERIEAGRIEVRADNLAAAAAWERKLHRERIAAAPELAFPDDPDRGAA